MKLVHCTLAVDGWAVTFGTAKRGLGHFNALLKVSRQNFVAKFGDR